MSDAAPQAMIVVDSVSRTYGKGAAAVHAVRDVSFEIPAGSFVTIVGASGSGKSTLLNMLGTLDRPDQGKVFVAGTDLYSLGDNDLTRFRRDRIGFVFQFFHLLPTLSRKLGEYSARKLEQRGLKLILNQRVNFDTDTAFDLQRTFDL